MIDSDTRTAIECAVQASFLEELLRRTWPMCTVSAQPYRPCRLYRRGGVAMLLPFALRMLTFNVPKAIERKHFGYAKLCIHRARLMIHLNHTTDPWKNLFPHGHHVEPALASPQLWASR